MKINPFDFSYESFIRLLVLIKISYCHLLFSEAPRIVYAENKERIVFIRHDVDLDLEKAVTMAKIEAEHGIRSCYMVMTQCPFYLLKEERSKFLLRELIHMGHEVGLHYNYAQSSIDILSNEIENQINCECNKIEEITKSRVDSISFHRPLKEFLYGPFLIANRINAYSKELMTWYLSDSKGCWREGNPIFLLEQPKENILQLLIHPIWWDSEHRPAKDRLQSFFDIKTTYLSTTEKKYFDINLESHLNVFRSKRIEK